MSDELLEMGLKRIVELMIRNDVDQLNSSFELNNEIVEVIFSIKRVKVDN